MSTATILSAALDALHVVFPTAVVTMTVDGTDIVALRESSVNAGDLTGAGTDAYKTGTLRVKHSLLRALKIGETITVDGKPSIVTNDDKDPAGIVRRIQYTESRPHDITLGPI